MLKLLRRRSKTPEAALAKILPSYELPHFPATAMQCMQLLREPDEPLKRIAEVLEADPGLHVRVLRTVNSAAFGLAHRIGNVKHAVTMLGRSRLESLILSVVVKDTLPSSEDKTFNEQFWLCASRKACIGRALAEILHPATHTEAFAACLLQDIAVPVLFKSHSDTYRKTYQHWLENPETRLEVLEREALGYDHQTIGGLIAEHWNLGDYLVSAIAKHHDDDPNATDAAVRLAALLRPDPDHDGSAAVLEAAETRYALQRQHVQTLLEESAVHAADYVKTLSST